MFINTIPFPELNQENNIVDVILDILHDSNLNDGDIISIPKSLTYNDIITIDDIANSVKKYNTVTIIYSIYNLNRFSNIIRGIARGVDKIILISPYIDEVGNEIRNHPYTGLNYDEEFRNIIESENTELEFYITSLDNVIERNPELVKKIQGSNALITLSTHTQLINNINNLLLDVTGGPVITLKDLCGNIDFGLLGSEQIDDTKNNILSSKEDLQSIVDSIKSSIKYRFNKDVEVMIYGNGLYQDSKETIWEYIDSISSFAYTNGLKGNTKELTPKPYIDVLATISSLIQKPENFSNIIHISGYNLN